MDKYEYKVRADEIRALIQEKKYTLEGASAQLLRELSDYDTNAEAKDAIRSLRATLTDLYMTVRKYRQKSNDATQLGNT